MRKFEKQLLEHFRGLDESQQHTVLDFTEFLAMRGKPGAPLALPVPLDIPRPEQESVIKAIKRLRATYPMLEPGKLLNDTSTQMSRHMVQGEAAETVIDDLERMFRRHYDALLAEHAARQASAEA